jgi:hypothetical protein
MLFRDDVLKRIPSGDVRRAYRRWRRPTVKAGGRLRTPAGEIGIDAVEVRGAQVACSLTNVTPAGIDIAKTDWREGRPALTWNGREWLVAWQQWIGPGTEIRARHVTPLGFLVEGSAEEQGVLLRASGSSPHVAWDGERYRLGWFENTAGGGLGVAFGATSDIGSEPDATSEPREAEADRISFATTPNGRGWCGPRHACDVMKILLEKLLSSSWGKKILAVA